MRRNIFALGARTVSGKCCRVMGAGELNVHDSDVLTFYAAGGIKTANSFINKARAAGGIFAKNARFGDAAMAGEVVLQGETKAKVFSILGKLTAEYLSCKVLRNHSKSKMFYIIP